MRQPRGGGGGQNGPQTAGILKKNKGQIHAYSAPEPPGGGALAFGGSHKLSHMIAKELCQYGTFAMFPDLGYIKWFNTLPGRVRWVGYAPKPLETCLVRPGAGASSPETVMRFHSNRRHHESSQARLDQAHAPPTTPRRTKATSPMTLRLRRGGKEVGKGWGHPSSKKRWSQAICAC